MTMVGSKDKAEINIASQKKREGIVMALYLVLGIIFHVYLNLKLSTVIYYNHE